MARPCPCPPPHAVPGKKVIHFKRDGSSGSPSPPPPDAQPPPPPLAPTQEVAADTPARAAATEADNAGGGRTGGGGRKRGGARLAAARAASPRPPPPPPPPPTQPIALADDGFPVDVTVIKPGTGEPAGPPPPPPPPLRAAAARPPLREQRARAERPPPPPPPPPRAARSAPPTPATTTPRQPPRAEPAAARGPPPAPTPTARPAAPGAASTFFAPERSFAAAGASPDLAAALASLGVARPSHIQAAALRALKHSQRDARDAPSPPPVLLADHAGSGKTLAYLVPAIQALAEAERRGARPSSGPRPPSALVLVPTAELAAQVLATARGIARGGGPAFRSVGLTGGRPWRTQREALADGCDLVVATPGRAAAALADGALDVKSLHTLILDEADVLLAAARTDGGGGGGSASGPDDDEELPGGPPAGFVEQVRPILHAAGPRGRGPADAPPPRLVLVTATVPEPTYRDWSLSFPGLTPVLGPGLHRTAPGVTQRLVDCSFGGGGGAGGDGEDGGGGASDPDAAFQRKAEALVRLLRDDADRGGPSARPPGHAIVFVHTVASARRVENLLARQLGGLVTPLAYHAAVSPDARAAHLGALARPPPPPPPPGGPGAQQPPPRRLVLIATDRASRGIDTAHADHVVLFDFPRDPSEYVRRAGRVARGAGGGGVVSLLATGRTVRIARDLVERGAKGLPVHRVPGADV